MSDLLGADDRERRELAITRIRARRDFRVHLVAYVLVNAALWVLWIVVAGADGHPWPIWPTLGWGIGLALHWWSINRRPVSAEDVADEVKRMRRQ